jgi:hypothetical protein
MNRQPARTFQDLIVWQKAHRFALDIYRLTEDFPKTEVYGLTSQLRRAAVSVPANIAQGSLEECRYYLILSADFGYGKTTELTGLLEEVSKLLDAYSAAILNSDS